MTVPDLPARQDGICYYIWTDAFFGDVSLGRMNQFVPQLILGEALDGSSGPPDFVPRFGTHHTWKFGAHYFFEIWNETTKQVDSHAAYGSMFDAFAGETLFTSFVQSEGKAGPVWTLTMGAVNDTRRVSTVVAAQPYMGLGRLWAKPTVSWAERNYSNVCINACWELYGATDRAHSPSSGSQYNISITREPGKRPHRGPFPWVTRWDEDEGAGSSCASSTIKVENTSEAQSVLWDVQV